MADKIVLKIDNVALNLTDDKYTEDFSNVDSLNKSEAGTNLRAVTRTGIPSMSISYTCDDTELAVLEGKAKASSLTVKKWSESSGTEITWKCFMNSFKKDLIVETATERLYKVSFKLNDLEN